MKKIYYTTFCLSPDYHLLLVLPGSLFGHPKIQEKEPLVVEIRAGLCRKRLCQPPRNPADYRKPQDPSPPEPVWPLNPETVQTAQEPAPPAVPATEGRAEDGLNGPHPPISRAYRLHLKAEPGRPYALCEGKGALMKLPY
jgi:hypothetical protein